MGFMRLGSRFKAGFAAGGRQKRDKHVETGDWERCMFGLLPLLTQVFDEVSSRAQICIPTPTTRSVLPGSKEVERAY